MLKKRLKKIGISALTLLVLFLAAGIAYVYYSDKSSSIKTNSSPSALLYQPIKPPPKPRPNASVGVAEEAFDSPVAPGASTSIIMQTTSGATCTIAITNQNGRSVFNLKPKTADAYGSVTWSWVVPVNTTVGDYPLKVICRLGKNWAVYDDTLVVTN